MTPIQSPTNDSLILFPYFGYVDKHTPKSLQKFFEESHGQTLTDAEVLAHKDNLVKFFSIFITIDQKNKRKEVIKDGQII